MEALYANSSGKIKSRKKSLGKENEENRPKEERNTIAPLCQGKKKNTLPKTIKALGLDKRLRQSRHLKIRSVLISLEQCA